MQELRFVRINLSIWTALNSIIAFTERVHLNNDLSRALWSFQEAFVHFYCKKLNQAFDAQMEHFSLVKLSDVESFHV